MLAAGTESSVAKNKFNPHPFAYHQELELEVTTLTNLGVGLGRVALASSEVGGRAPAPSASSAAGPARRGSGSPGEGGWVVMVPFALPGERVRARIFRNHPNYSEADLVTVLTPSPHRVAPRCPLFGRCGGCQYQNLAYAEQLQWKRRQVRELLAHLAGVDFPVAPVIASPVDYGYRSKITPHFHLDRRPADAGRPEPTPIGFLQQGSRHVLVDVPRCEIATEPINRRLVGLRAEVREEIAGGQYRRGATLLLRQAAGGVTTDYDARITEEIPLAGRPPLRLQFLARDFFQNNPFILPAFAGYVRDQAAGTGARFLLDVYCGSGLFALTAAPAFARVAGVEVSETSVAFARENAAANGVANAHFLAGDAAAIFSGLDFPPDETVAVLDPPRKGCDAPFLRQLFVFRPRAVVYVSCDPATQMRDLGQFTAAGYALTAVQPFDLFPQTRHLECVITLRRAV